MARPQMDEQASRFVVLVLASRSPRRPVLLRFLTDEFVVDAIPVEEVAPRALPVGEAVEVIARKKALAVSARHPDAMVIAADTVVVLGDELVGKAPDELAARRTLAMLAGVTHQVWTGVALAWGGKAVDHAHAVTAVHMDRLPVAVLDTYVSSSQWEGKAGGYGIQDPLLAPFLHIKAGPWSNVVGLPLAQTRDLLRRNGVTVRDPPDEAWLRDHNPFETAPKSA
jgi:septum formation protein